jgi:hypothetical protein
MAFRFQLFVLRSSRAIVEQNAAGNWELIALSPQFHLGTLPGLHLPESTS